MPKVNSIFYKIFLALKRKVALTSQGLIAYYELGSSQSYPGSGLILYDLSGKSNNATLANAITHSTTPGYFDFVGSVSGDDYFTIPDTWFDGSFTTGMAFNIWVRTNTTRGIFKSNLASLSVNYQSSTSQFTISITTTVLSGTAKSNQTVSHVFTTTLKWHMITGVYENSTKSLKIYLNGQLVATTTNTLSPGTYYKSSAAAVINVGRVDGTGTATDSWYFLGRLGSFRIYEQSITAEAVTSLYNEEKTKYAGLDTFVPTVQPSLNYSLSSPTPTRWTTSDNGYTFSFFKSGFASVLWQLNSSYLYYFEVTLPTAPSSSYSQITFGVQNPPTRVGNYHGGTGGNGNGGALISLWAKASGTYYIKIRIGSWVRISNNTGSSYTEFPWSTLTNGANHTGQYYFGLYDATGVAAGYQNAFVNIGQASWAYPSQVITGLINP